MTEVARRARAWVETHSRLLPLQWAPSPAVRGRGLKRHIRPADGLRPNVARRARAWVETLSSSSQPYSVEVARRARAWVETFQLQPPLECPDVARRARAWVETAMISGRIARARSPAVRGRGLKLTRDAILKAHDRRPPCAGVG